MRQEASQVDEAQRAFAGRLEALMDRHGVNQRALAESCGCSYQTVGKWIRGSWPGGEYIVKLAKALQTDPVYLLAGDDETAAWQVTRADAVTAAKAEVARAVRETLTEVLASFESATQVVKRSRGEGPSPASERRGRHR